ncbi:phage tail sheath family protein [Enterobacter ludwigii]
MTVITSYPGVYLSEQASLNFAITIAETCVPAFAYTYSYNLPPDQQVWHYYSWQDVVKSLNGEVHSGYTFYNVLYTWFSLGGGECYLIPYPKLEEAVKQYDNITLIVSSGTDSTEYGTHVQKDVIAAVNNLVAQGYPIFGLFDGPYSKIEADATPQSIMESYPESSHAAVFYPWCSSASNKKIPPSVVAALSIARTDSTRGPWKAPANVVIEGITPKYPVSNDLQGRFSQGKALNMIRSFPDAGTVVWGARTLEDSDNWRYIPVRRLFTMVERDIQKALNKLVFEPNNQPTWMRVKTAVNNYLYRLWQQGALAGNSESEAWFVDIGKDITMTDDDINQGKMIVKIGLAATRPAEFILLQFSQDIAQ